MKASLKGANGVGCLDGYFRTLKIGDLMGTVIVPFMKLESEEDYEKITEIAENTIDFWAENGLEHERCGEMIERIGLVNFLEGIEIEVDPHMISDPRQSSYVRMDGWDEEAVKWFERQIQSKADQCFCVFTSTTLERCSRIRRRYRSALPEGLRSILRSLLSARPKITI